jgi:hypothetical protein
MFRPTCPYSGEKEKDKKKKQRSRILQAFENKNILHT